MPVKTRQKKEDEDVEEEETEQEEAEDDKADKGSGDSAAGGSDLESHIRKVVRDVVDGLLGPGDQGVKSSPATDESSVFKMVKDAQEKLKKEEEKDAQFKSVADSVETLKKVVEKAPARDGLGGKIQRLMWGTE